MTEYGKDSQVINIMIRTVRKATKGSRKMGNFLLWSISYTILKKEKEELLTLSQGSG